jgi:hypothetical protein
MQRIHIAAFTALLACGCKPNTESVPATSPQQANAEKNDGTARPIPINFILNPDETRPLGYPESISVTAAEDFIVDKKLLSQTCGPGGYDSSYGDVMFPWLERPESLSYRYMQAETGSFLTSLTIGTQTYSRSDRDSNLLMWTRNSEPRRQMNVVGSTLTGGNSSDRKLLLMKISRSLAGVEIDRFEPKKRSYLANLVKFCQSDVDTEVASLAIEICELLKVNEP